VGTPPPGGTVVLLPLHIEKEHTKVEKSNQRKTTKPQNEEVNKGKG
jgi:hypothetical protein